MVTSALYISILMALTPMKQSQDSSCEARMEKITEQLTSMHAEKERYVHFKSYMMEGEEKSPILDNRMWSSGNHFYLDNALMTIYQDEKYIVYILKKEKRIAIDYAPVKGNSAAQMRNPADEMKKLKEIASNISCPDESSVSLVLPHEVDGMRLPYQYVTLVVDGQNVLRKGLYSRGNITEVYEYLSYTTNKSYAFRSATEQVLNNNSLRKEYTDYELQDLRKK